jgi:hypothetical protein
MLAIMLFAMNVETLVEVGQHSKNQTELIVKNVNKMKNWIKEKDRLPTKADIGKYFLVNVKQPTNRDEIKMFEWYDNGLEIYFLFDTYEYTQKVTHWQPLPASPDE